MPFSPLDYLRHILDEVDYLSADSGGITAEQFLADETRKRAYARSIEIIGEASKQIPQTVRDLAPEIEWSRMAGMRDRVIHAYFGVDYEVVWLAASEKAPALAAAVRQLIATLESTPSPEV